MGSGTLGAARAKRDTRWSAVTLGWGVAVLAGVAVSPVLRILYSLIAEPRIERGELTVALVVVSLVSGFLSYLLGGYVAARAAGRAGGKHGALTAFFGLTVGVVLTLVLAVFGLVFAEGIAVPPASFGLGRTALLAGLILFLTNLFGGFVGGKLGEPSYPDIEHLR